MDYSHIIQRQGATLLWPHNWAWILMLSPPRTKHGYCRANRLVHLMNAAF